MVLLAREIERRGIDGGGREERVRWRRGLERGEKGKRR